MNNLYSSSNNQICSTNPTLTLNLKKKHCKASRIEKSLGNDTMEYINTTSKSINDQLQYMMSYLYENIANTMDLPNDIDVNGDKTSNIDGDSGGGGSSSSTNDKPNRMMMIRQQMITKLKELYSNLKHVYKTFNIICNQWNTLFDSIVTQHSVALRKKNQEIENLKMKHNNELIQLEHNKNNQIYAIMLENNKKEQELYDSITYMLNDLNNTKGFIAANLDDLYIILQEQKSKLNHYNVLKRTKLANIDKDIDKWFNGNINTENSSNCGTGSSGGSNGNNGGDVNDHGHECNKLNFELNLNNIKGNLDEITNLLSPIVSANNDKIELGLKPHPCNPNTARNHGENAVDTDPLNTTSKSYSDLSFFNKNDMNPNNLDCYHEDSKVSIIKKEAEWDSNLDDEESLDNISELSRAMDLLYRAHVFDVENLNLLMTIIGSHRHNSDDSILPIGFFELFLQGIKINNKMSNKNHSLSNLLKKDSGHDQYDNFPKSKGEIYIATSSQLEIPEAELAKPIAIGNGKLEEMKQSLEKIKKHGFNLINDKSKKQRKMKKVKEKKDVTRDELMAVEHFIKLDSPLDEEGEEIKPNEENKLKDVCLDDLLNAKSLLVSMKDDSTSYGIAENAQPLDDDKLGLPLLNKREILSLIEEEEPIQGNTTGRGDGHSAGSAGSGGGGGCSAGIVGGHNAGNAGSGGCHNAGIADSGGRSTSNSGGHSAGSGGGRSANSASRGAGNCGHSDSREVEKYSRLGLNPLAGHKPSPCSNSNSSLNPNLNLNSSTNPNLIPFNEKSKLKPIVTSEGMMTIDKTLNTNTDDSAKSFKVVENVQKGRKIGFFSHNTPTNAMNMANTPYSSGISSGLGGGGGSTRCGNGNCSGGGGCLISFQFQLGNGNSSNTSGIMLLGDESRDKVRSPIVNLSGLNVSKSIRASSFINSNHMKTLLTDNNDNELHVPIISYNDRSEPIILPIHMGMSLFSKSVAIATDMPDNESIMNMTFPQYIMPHKLNTKQIYKCARLNRKNRVFYSTKSIDTIDTAAGSKHFHNMPPTTTTSTTIKDNTPKNKDKDKDHGKNNTSNSSSISFLKMNTNGILVSSAKKVPLIEGKLLIPGGKVALKT